MLKKKVLELALLFYTVLNGDKLGDKNTHHI